MALVDGLVEYFKLDESSGNRGGAHAGYTLTQTGTIGSATGKVYATALDGVPGDVDEWLEYSATDPFSFSGPRTVALWVFIDVFTGVAKTFVNKGQSSSSTREWRLRHDPSAAEISLIVNATAPNNVAIGSLSTATWYLAIAQYDPAVGANGTIYLRVNNGSQSSTALGGAITTIGTQLRVANALSSGTANQQPDARVGPILFWTRLLTASEETELWNGGNGLTYEAMIGTPYLAFPRWGSVRR